MHTKQTQFGIYLMLVIGLFGGGVFLSAVVSRVVHRAPAVNVQYATVNQPEIAAVPLPNSVIAGEQKLQASLEGLSAANYEMYWQVEGSPDWVLMSNSPDGTAKEHVTNTASWPLVDDLIYQLHFRAVDTEGTAIAALQYDVELAAAPVAITETAAEGQTATPQPVTPTPKPKAAIVPPIAQQSKVYSGQALYVDPTSEPARSAAALASSDPATAAVVSRLAAQPMAKWVGAWSGDVQSQVAQYFGAAQAVGGIPVLVVYALPYLHCTGGGLSSAGAYKTFVDAVSQGIAGRQGMVIIEPDALAMMNDSCLTSDRQTERAQLISYAVTTLKKGSTTVYIDAGHAGWVATDKIAERLRGANIANANGFSLNVSNYGTTASQITYGDAVSALVGGKHYVIDTSRNGAGPSPDNEWCNAPGRAVGERPTLATGKKLVDAYLWIKVPGESDGTCNGGPTAGRFWVEYAVGLAQRGGL